MKRTENAKMSSTRKKMQETCVTLTGDNISERLKALSLPNSHLVEAVLKQHSHIFTADCRDRLRNLLQVIVNVNTGNKKKFEKLDEKLKMGCIKNLQQRINDFHKSKSNQKECEAQTDPSLCDDTSDDYRREETFIYYGATTSSMVCNASSSVAPEDIPEDVSPTTHASIKGRDDVKENKSKEKSTARKTSKEKPKIFSNDEISATYAKTADVYRCELFHAASEAASGDHDSDLEALFEGLNALNDSSPPQLYPREFGDVKTDPKSKKTTSQIPRSVRSRHLSTVREEKKPAEERRRRSVPRQDTNSTSCPLSPIPERRRRAATRGHSKRRVINVPSLAVRAYVALIMDMQRNCALYETFRNNLIKPIEMYKEPYILAAYDCWMDYMTYVKNTLDYLHPYIMNLVRVYYARDKNDRERRHFETKIPKVLVNSMKNIKTWKCALQETIDCCDQLFCDEKLKTDVHDLYERYYQKVSELPTVSLPKNQKKHKQPKNPNEL